MRVTLRVGVLILLTSLFSVTGYAQSAQAPAQAIQSPNGKLSLSFRLTGDGEPAYRLSFGGKAVLEEGKLGIELKGQPPFTSGFTVERADTSLTDEAWEPVWGEVKRIRNHYRELAVTLQQADHKARRLTIRFRLFDDGLGFR